MDRTLKENISAIIKKNPRLSEKAVFERIKNIKWPLSVMPRTCEVTVNALCNNRCLFCYSDPASLNDRTQPPLETLCRALYSGRKKGAWIAVIIGGEPTLRKDIGKIGAFAAKAGYPCVKICTNGRKLADKKTVRALAGDGFNMFDISIHAPRAAIHDRLVGVKGAFSSVMKAAENVRSLGLELGTNQVINKLNYRLFPEFMELAYNRLGINYYNIIYGHYIGAMEVNRETLKVPVSVAAPFVKKGMGVLKKSGFPALARLVVNFPPCLMKGYENILADWEKDERNGDPLTVGGRTINMKEMKNAQSSYAAACPSCAFYAECRGFDSKYMAMTGGKEFRAVKKVSGSYRIETLFGERHED